MNAPIPVNVLDVALRVMSAPDEPVSMSMVEAYALCLFVLQQNDLPAPAESPTFLPVEHFPASLAAAVARLIAAEARCEALDERDDTPHLAAFQARDAAFNALKIRFEKEFPNV